MMSRPREFEMDEALERALDVFWSKGYQGASMADLLAAMGLSKSSFYAAFGCKRDVFAAALRRYSDGYLAEARQLFDPAGDPLAQLRAYLLRAIESGAPTDCVRRGCMIVNVAVELAPEDTAIEQEVRAHSERMVSLLAEVLRRGQQQGRILPDITVEHWGRHLLTMVTGLYVLRKGGAEPALLFPVIDTCLTSITGPSPG
jgi:TetR/AcrR family transcriptional repressor of nem operon